MLFKNADNNQLIKYFTECVESVNDNRTIMKFINLYVM